MATQKLKDVPKPPEFDELVKDLHLEQLQENEGSEWLDSLKERSSRLGKSIKELLVDERAALRESTYPGPECLEPYELELYFNETLSNDRVSHTRECMPCAALLKTAAPSEEGLNVLIARIRNEVQEPSAVVDTTYEPRRWVIIDALAAALPVGISVWAALFVYWYRLPNTTSENVVSSVSWVVIQPAIFGLVALVALFGILAFLLQKSSFFASHKLLASSGGAFAVSLIIAPFLFYGTYKSLVNITRKSEIEIALVQTQLAQAIANSVTMQVQDLAAPINLLSGPVLVQQISASPNEIKYQATVRDLPGKLVAQVKDDKGRVYWQPTKEKSEKIENEEVGKLVLGTVKSVDSKNLALIDKAGLLYDLKLSGELYPQPSRGERVLAVVKPESAVVQSVHSIANSR